MRRAVTVGAVGVLWLDAALLGYVGAVRESLPLLAGAIGCALGSVVVGVAWRRYRRTVAELTAARRELARDARAIRALLRTHPAP